MQDVIWYNMLICITWNLAVIIFVAILFHTNMSTRRRLLFITNTKEDYIVEDSKTFFAWDALEASHLYQTPIGSKGAILCFRILMLIYFIAAILNNKYGAGTGLVSLQVWLKFYTNWTFVLFVAYQINGIYIILSRDQKPQVMQQGNPLTFHEKLSILILSIVIPGALFSTICYWYWTKVFIFGEFMFHGMNCIFLLIDLFFIRTTIVSSHFLATLIFSQVYVAYLWMEGVLAENWVYPQADWSKTQGVLFYIYAAPLLLIVFVFMYLVAYTREKIFFQKKASILENGI